MKTLLEKSLIYTVGGIVGLIIGYSLIMIELPAFSITETCRAVVFTSIIFGVLFSIALVEGKEKKIFKKNTDLRNETVALITHEMRTGLTSTGWAIQNILDKYGEHVTQEDTEMLEGVVKSIHTTIMHSVNLLDISLLDIGKLEITLESMNLEKIETAFKEIVGKFKMETEKKGIVLTSEIRLDHDKEVEVDFVRLRIILENLLENAIQYTLDGKKEIHVIILNNKNELNISVKDTGIGIPESEKEKIFSEFYRAQNARKALSTGSGIGLYTCAQYTKAHRGKISFESKEGVGTTFFVDIPLKTEADVDGFLSKI